MCGIVGRQQRDPLAVGTLERLARRMNRCLRHRGPDSEGYWTDPYGRCALGFSRLSNPGPFSGSEPADEV